MNGTTSTNTIKSHILSEADPLPPSFLLEMANDGPLNEISNSAGAVRHHLYHHGMRDRTTGKLLSSMLFFIYQTTRHGPQNGFRLCYVHRGFYIASAEKASMEKDDVDRLEAPIPQGHMEMIILGEAPPPIPDDVDDDEYANSAV
ncbi:hypothetical protein B0H66DRAFT_114832 [Apodospora peruviana]|uniref:Uncharacterized protein n=1 Tax=Apodospora peruviana TaxID=516989 RepID=A0AAE0IHE1_9PEZI|nr:hypothetical protein B0H66DRAFT_114832 [Apodospora peruviana]